MYDASIIGGRESVKCWILTWSGGGREGSVRYMDPNKGYKLIKGVLEWIISLSKSCKMLSSGKFRALQCPQNSLIREKRCGMIEWSYLDCPSLLSIFNPKPSTLNFEFSILNSPFSYLKSPLCNLNSQLRSDSHYPDLSSVLIIVVI